MPKKPTVQEKELSTQELDQVGSFPEYMEELDDFSKEISGIFTIKPDNHEEKVKNPEGFISVGRPD